MRVIQYRVQPGTQIPDGLDLDDVFGMMLCIAYHLQARYGADETELWERLTSWCIEWCENWTQGWPQKGNIIHRLLSAVRGRTKDLKAAEAAKYLRLTWEERCLLKIGTIRPFDKTPAEFFALAEQRKLNGDRVRQEANRRDAGQKTWDDHAWQHRTKPWELIGSRKRTWQRYKSEGRLSALLSKSEITPPTWLVDFCLTWDAAHPAQNGAVSSRVGGATPTGDEKVPTVVTAVRRAKAKTTAVSCEGRSGVLQSEGAKNATGDAAAATAKSENAAPDDPRRPLRAFDQVMPAKGVRNARRSAA